jgi:hypothetical protein
LSLDGADVVGERVFWRPDPTGPRRDVHHLNTVYGWRGEVLVAGFGRKAGTLWSTATNGFIVNATRGTTLVSGIRHPHSLLACAGRLHYCESRTQTVRVVGEARRQQVGGYSRGLCRVGRHLFVGASQGRRVSKSTGLIDNRADPGVVAGQCLITRLQAGTLATEATAELGAYGDEIYDLLPVGDVTGWPVTS